MKIAVTGAAGLLGWHTAARLHAQNCAARYAAKSEPFDLVTIDHTLMDNPDRLSAKLKSVEAILHFAGVNRGEDAVVEAANPDIAGRLVTACKTAKISPHIVYANSIHAGLNTTPYGRSKAHAGEILQKFCQEKYTNLVLPHIFGEGARPNYNNVTATLIEQLWEGVEPAINKEGRVQLLHSGAAAQIAIDAAFEQKSGTISPPGRNMSIPDLYARLKTFHDLYAQNIFPDLSDPFDLALFNSYRSIRYPLDFERLLELNKDKRGVLFETTKNHGASQTFISVTPPGGIRGNHFHSNLVERFVVLSGEAVIRVRKVLTTEVHEFGVSGEEPVAIDQIPFHTHNIENTGSSDLVTFFWAHRLFDPSEPDTYADAV